MAGRFRFSWEDFSNTKRASSFPGLVVTAANHDAQLTKATDLVDSIHAVTHAGLIEYSLIGRETEVDAPATDAEGQVEKTWLVTGHYASDSSIKRSFRIYNAALDASYMTAGTNEMDLASTEGAALKTDIEAAWVEDGGTGSVVVEKITFSK